MPGKGNPAIRSYWENDMDDDDDASVAGIEGGKGQFSHSFSFNQDFDTQDVEAPGNHSPAAGFGEENDFTGTCYFIQLLITFGDVTALSTSLSITTANLFALSSLTDRS